MSSVLIKRTQYKLVLVEETNAPAGIEGGNWFRYVVGEGKDRIEGKQPGTLNSVTKHAEAFAEELNSRNARGGSVFKPRSTKDAKKK